jgi:hypothetical protein
VDLGGENMDLQTAETQIIKTNKNTLTRYTVVEEKIDIGDLEIELRGIEEQLSKVMGDKELLEWARANYPQPDIEPLLKRKGEIEELLSIK